MDAAEIGHIAATLLSAIAEAGANAKQIGIGPEFRELVCHARELHEVLVDAMLANELLRTEYLAGLSVTAGNAIERLCSLAEMPDCRMQ